MNSTHLIAALAMAGTLLAANPKSPVASVPYNIPLWDESKVPLATGGGPLDAPFVTVFLPPESKRNGTSVVVAPGGGNIMMMYGSEGMEIAERFNDWGAAAFVLTYRLSPKYGENARVLDGNRAVQLVRARVKEWKLDPAKIGFAGFSAGSSLGRSVVAAPKPPTRAPPIRWIASARVRTTWCWCTAQAARRRASNSRTFRRRSCLRLQPIAAQRMATRSSFWR